MATKRASKPRQLAGPGIRGAETDTPLYHIDVDREQLTQLVSDPVEYLAKVGLGKAQGIAPAGAMSVNLSRLDQRWTPDGWVQAADDEPTTQWCCYVVGDTTTCHQH
jgi:hypothetical protein